jgi:pyruvate/2-oxoacid:ferredoxin oxidoreductase beta subunit
VSLALIMGATFVARSFSGDKKQLVPLIKAGLAHRGRRLHRRHQPCVAFNNHPGSTKSYDYIRRPQRGRQPPRLLAEPRSRSTSTTAKARSSKCRSTTARS